jgi:hypothetical protein
MIGAIIFDGMRSVNYSGHQAASRRKASERDPLDAASERRSQYRTPDPPQAARSPWRD